MKPRSSWLVIAGLAWACGGDEPESALVAIVPAASVAAPGAPAPATAGSTDASPTIDGGAAPSAAALADPPRIEALEREVESLRGELERSSARVRDLQQELARAREERVARENEWLAYTRSISQLDELAKLAQVRFQPQVEPSAAPALAPATIEPASGDASAKADAGARNGRDLEIARTLRALFFSEQISGLDLLECGHLQDGAIGPVVLRTLDDRGVPLGSLCAERMKLEASLSARTLTLILEEGYERRGSERTPFAVPPDAALDHAPAAGPEPKPDAGAAQRRGERRIVLAYVDPQPWIDALPELFRDVDRHVVHDDGHWDRMGVVLALNRLLRIDAAAGIWRVVSLGGVDEGVLREVQIDQLDREGRLEKKLFADRLTVQEQKHGVVLLLEDGAQLRGDVKTPFLDGRYRIFLPRADLAEWRAANVPGLAPLVSKPAPPAEPAPR